MTKKWKRIEPTSIIKSDWRVIVNKSFIDENGKERSFDTYGQEAIDHVGIVAITKDKKAILAKQFRVGPEKIMLEIPGGTIDDGEDREQAASRELLEETGYKAGEKEFLGRVHKDAYMNHGWNYFLATGCEFTGSQNLDEGEYVDQLLVSIDKLIEIAKSDKMTDSVAVLMAYDYLMDLKED